MAFSVLDVYPKVKALSGNQPERVEIILRSDVGRGPPPSWSLKCATRGTKFVDSIRASTNLDDDFVLSIATRFF